MAPSTAARPPSSGTVHWTVRSNYPLRTASFLAMFVVAQVLGRPEGYAPAFHAWLGLTLLVYPHAAYWLARRSADPMRAELRHLTFDAVLLGALSAQLGFPLAFSACVYVASSLNLVINFGWTGALRSQLAFGGGALAVGAVEGWTWAPETSPVVTALCLLANVVYMIAIGLTAHRRNMRLRQVRRELSERSEELSQALERLQQAQAGLLEAEKLAALGSLVAGVAHELNTPIGTALSASSALQERCDALTLQVTEGSIKRSALLQQLGQAQAMARLIEDACRRSAALITSFKQVAADQRAERTRDFDLREVVGDHLATLKPSLRHSGVTLRQNVPPGIDCHGHAGTLGQVVGGLVDNAFAHAFGPEDSGVVTVEAQVQGGRVTLTVQDNGHGMAPEVLKHAFDPFFTTRPGQGQHGLGLTICHNLATGVLGGSLRAESREGEGSRFRLEFPQRHTPQAPDAPPGAEPAP